MNNEMEMRVFAFQKRMWILLWICSLPVCAGSVGTRCEVWDVTTPCLMDSWGLEAHALLLQASSTVMDTPQKIITSTGQADYGTKPTWQWGFQVGGTYLWNSGNDFVWSWSNYRNEDINSAIPHPVDLGALVRNEIFIFPIRQVLRDVTLDTASFNTTYEWDQINFEFGQNMDLPVRVKMRPQAGLQIVRIAKYLNSNFGSSQDDVEFLYSTRTSSMFNGLGSRSGLELRWESDWGLSVYGRGNLGLIYGPRKNNEYVSNVLTNEVTIYNTSWSRVVPTIDGQLGAAFQFEVVQGLLSLDLGWQWHAYQGALMETAFSIQGLFFGLKWLGTLA